MFRLLALIPGGGVFAAIWAFLTSTIGLVLIAAIAAYIAGYSSADRKADLEILQSQVATLNADQKTSQGALVLAERQTEDLQDRLHDNQAKVDAITSDLAKRKEEVSRLRSEASKRPHAQPAPALRECGLNASDAKRLKEIR